MATFRLGPSSYFGDPATLVEGDQEGMRLFACALQSARDNGHAIFEGEGGIRHRIEERNGAATITLGQYGAVWQLDSSKLDELLALVDPLTADRTSGHQYLDIKSPTETLVISVKEFS
ncbi:hypothetical protein [Mycobacteroides chelonae]|uniref:hypothetical protein n=1 Tax=Mycobacteroides chelonae TaxID=1774 RepID=UPI0004AA8957|nr:hypothetical protein [Mycobacteroides chelonae]MBF9317639.1 hypothetical protein [Mycobacteroides chelonae]OHT72949.1 hypothetical protein BKG66_09085 [Mycobacteroides chelonae]OHT74512.1 hypothetical protein BKG67_08880 [Mycobacteroides chelonae]OHT89598.1 hypothetical protein BKG70_09745 [Mycobacteroides chelonae]